LYNKPGAEKGVTSFSRVMNLMFSYKIEKNVGCSVEENKVIKNLINFFLIFIDIFYESFYGLLVTSFINKNFADNQNFGKKIKL